ncbi:MAG: oxygen-independent coproporphyrinogen III oxidase [Lachnospiraceae bacterium]|nr:oxygen-independent coproporphyrinogen III oxidase [Lachnospiraceae bacterium]
MTAGIYLHIPFCVKKCLYCDFISGANSKETIENYINSMVNEIESTDIKQDVDSVFIGGGTPSSIPPEYIAKVVDCLRIKLGNRFLKDSEITIETNPKTISENALKIYHDAGINRISMGLQSCIDSELKSLGRIHTFKDFLDSYNIATRYFDNINIDLISGIPHQTMDSFKESLKKVGDLNPNHISVYSLIIEEGTPFYEMYGPGGKFKDSLPNEDIDREMYHFTKEYLSTLGYNRYEISNYAKENKESRHNLKYWKGNNYYGFGIAAASLVDNIRYKNTDNLKEYIDAMGSPEKIRITQEILDIEDCMSEYMILGLRLIKGVSPKEFKARFNEDMENKYGDILNKYLNMGLLHTTIDGNFALTDKGLDVSNSVMEEFL